MPPDQDISQTPDPLRSVSNEDLEIILNRAIQSGSFSPLDFMNCNYYDWKQLEIMAKTKWRETKAGYLPNVLGSLIKNLEDRSLERMRLDRERIESGEWVLPQGDVYSEAHRLEMKALAESMDAAEARIRFLQERISILINGIPPVEGEDTVH